MNSLRTRVILRPHRKAPLEGARPQSCRNRDVCNGASAPEVRSVGVEGRLRESESQRRRRPLSHYVSLRSPLLRRPLRPQPQLDQRPRIRRNLRLPPIVALQLLHRSHRRRVPSPRRLARQIPRLDQRRLNARRTLHIHRRSSKMRRMRLPACMRRGLQTRMHAPAPRRPRRGMPERRMSRRSRSPPMRHRPAKTRQRHQQQTCANAKSERAHGAEKTSQGWTKKPGKGFALRVASFFRWD